MKKLLTLLCVLATVCAGTVHAQLWQKSPVHQYQQPSAAQRAAAIEAGQNQLWWGYIGSADISSSVGINMADTYHCAMFLTGQDDMTTGKTIRAVRFGLSATKVIGVKVWIASELPTGTPSADNTLWVKDVAKEDLSEAIDVAVDVPCTIPAQGLYVGYSFTITSTATEHDQYPILTGGTDHPNGLLLRTNIRVPNWATLYGQGYGVLAMKVLLEGEFAQNSVTPSFGSENYYVQMGQTVGVDLVLTNHGLADVNSISYTLDGGAEQTVNLSSPLAPQKSTIIAISVPADAKEQNSTKKLTITKVNGVANDSKEATAQFVLSTMEQLIQRNVVVEEFTGTGCGFCPRGLVGMEKLRQTFGDRFVGIGIHQYNEDDAMYIANYAPLQWHGAPSCMIDRTMNTDPYYAESGDICNEVRMAMNVPSTVEVDVVGVINEEETEVELTASVKSLFDTKDFSIEYVLVADGLKGTTAAWAQSNYYSSQAVPEEDLKIFGRGGKYGQSNIVGYVFNDVALAWAGGKMVQPLGQLSAGQVHKATHTLQMPTKATMRNALRKGTVYAVVLIVNPDGTIANAVRKPVVDAAGISTTQQDRQVTVTDAYVIDGMRLAAPQRGINIVRMADGSVRKVLVK